MQRRSSALKAVQVQAKVPVPGHIFLLESLQKVILHTHGSANVSIQCWWTTEFVWTYCSTNILLIMCSRISATGRVAVSSRGIEKVVDCIGWAGIHWRLPRGHWIPTRKGWPRTHYCSHKISLILQNLWTHFDVLGINLWPLCAKKDEQILLKSSTSLAHCWSNGT